MSQPLTTMVIEVKVVFVVLYSIFLPDEHVTKPSIT